MVYMASNPILDKIIQPKSSMTNVTLPAGTFEKVMVNQPTTKQLGEVKTIQRPSSGGGGGVVQTPQGGVSTAFPEQYNKGVSTEITPSNVQAVETGVKTQTLQPSMIMAAQSRTAVDVIRNAPNEGIVNTAKGLYQTTIGRLGKGAEKQVTKIESKLPENFRTTPQSRAEEAYQNRIIQYNQVVESLAKQTNELDYKVNDFNNRITKFNENAPKEYDSLHDSLQSKVNKGEISVDDANLILTNKYNEIQNKQKEFNGEKQYLDNSVEGLKGSTERLKQQGQNLNIQSVKLQQTERTFSNLVSNIAVGAVGTVLFIPKTIAQTITNPASITKTAVEVGTGIIELPKNIIEKPITTIGQTVGSIAAAELIGAGVSKLIPKETEVIKTTREIKPTATASITLNDIQKVSDEQYNALSKSNIKVINPETNKVVRNINVDTSSEIIVLPKAEDLISTQSKSASAVLKLNKDGSVSADRINYRIVKSESTGTFKVDFDKAVGTVETTATQVGTMRLKPAKNIPGEIITVDNKLVYEPKLTKNRLNNIYRSLSNVEGVNIASKEGTTFVKTKSLTDTYLEKQRIKGYKTAEGTSVKEYLRTPKESIKRYGEIRNRDFSVQLSKIFEPTEDIKSFKTGGKSKGTTEISSGDKVTKQIIDNINKGTSQAVSSTASASNEAIIKQIMGEETAKPIKKTTTEVKVNTENIQKGKALSKAIAQIEGTGQISKDYEKAFGKQFDITDINLGSGSSQSQSLTNKQIDKLLNPQATAQANKLNAATALAIAQINDIVNPKPTPVTSTDFTDIINPPTGSNYPGAGNIRGKRTELIPKNRNYKYTASLGRAIFGGTQKVSSKNLKKVMKELDAKEFTGFEDRPVFEITPEKKGRGQVKKQKSLTSKMLEDIGLA